MKTQNMGPLTLPELNVLLYRLRITMLGMRQADKASTMNEKRSGLSPAQLAKFANRLTSPATKNTRQEASRLRERIMLALRRHPDGLRVSELAGEVAATMEATRYALALLRSARKVSMAGMRATARWYAR